MSILVNDEKEVKKKKEKEIPLNYIEIKLDSLGKLGIPKVLHFRDFSIEETTAIASSTTENNLKIVVQCLSSMCFEKQVDLLHLTLDDLLTIVYTLHGTFISPTVSREVYINPDLPEEKLEKPENLTPVEIPIAKFKTTPLKSAFKEPFTLTDVRGYSCTFRLPRVGDLIKAQEQTEKQFFDQARSFSNLESKIKEIQEMKEEEKKKSAYLHLPHAEREAYEEYMTERMKYFYILSQSFSVVKVGVKPLKTIAERRKYIKEVPNYLWDQYNEICKTYRFGLDPEVTFFSDHHDEYITRRLLFRVVDFLQDSDSKGFEDIKVHFGS